MPIRITGMNSGLDTESIITALTQTKQTRLDNAKNDQKKLSWKSDKWKELNKKTVAFYNGTLNTMMFSSAYTKKTTTASDSSAVSVVTGSNAMNATQTLKITKLAKAAYLTGSKVTAQNSNTEVNKSTKLSDLGDFDTKELSITVGGGEAVSVDLSEAETIGDVLSKIKGTVLSKGADGTETKVSDKLDVNFDEKNGRFYVSAKETGDSSEFSFAGNIADALGLTSSNYIEGSKAEIYLNGEKYESDTNVFEINGLTITANSADPDKEITLTTKQDTSGVYDNIKKLLKEYNDLMKEFSTLYNADKATKYKMLTDDQKEEMSDKEIEDWENKIKDGLLSGDETLSNLRSGIRGVMMGGFNVTMKNGETKELSLASFGISTGSYFNTEENERDSFHIDGDPDDSTSSGNTDILKAMISTDPDAVQSFFTQLSQSLHDKMFDLMKGTSYSSSFTIYEDKLMASQYSAYNTKISDAQSALEAAQDKLYKKFSRMETSLAKINSNSGSLSSFFGGGG